MIIKCDITDLFEDDDYGEKVLAKCRRCGTETRGVSVLQCLFLMHHKCPGGMRHRYIEYDGIPDEREQYEALYRGDPTCTFTAQGLALHLRIKAAYEKAVQAASTADNEDDDDVL